VWSKPDQRRFHEGQRHTAPVSNNHEPARSVFVSEVQHDILPAQLHHQFLQRMQIVGEAAVQPHLTAGLGDGDFVAFFADIQPDVFYDRSS
jgi:hypothetical protein